MKKLYVLLAAMTMLTIVSQAQITILFDMGDTVSFCQGSSIDVTANITSKDSINKTLWSDGTSSNSITIKEAGYHYITVEDIFGMSASDSVFAKVTPLPDASIITPDTAVCNTSQGFNVNVADPTGSFIEDTYVYQGENYFDVMYAPSGENTIHYVVRDQYGCESTDSISVNVVALSVTYISEGDESCDNSFIGTIETTVSGGIEPYTYEWSNGIQTSILSDVPQGSYYVSVTDSLGCSSYSYTDVYPKGQTTPIAKAVFIDDTTTKKYAPFVAHIKNYSTNYCDVSWSVTYNNNYHIFNTTDLEFICKEAGTYYIELTVYAPGTGDGGGSDFQYFDFVVVDPEVDTVEQKRCENFDVSLNIKGNICYGETNGEIEANVTGGVAPYRYLWSTTRTDNKLKNLKAGIYSVTVADMEGCKAVAIGEVKDSAQMYPATSSITQLGTCSASDGEITVNMEGGTPPYSFSWSDGNTLNSLTKLSVGNYSYTVTDKNNCSYVSTVTLSAPDQPIIDVYNIGASECDRNSGFLDIYYNTTDNVGKWSDMTDDAALHQKRIHLAAGDYTLVVKNTTSGCESKRTISIPSVQPRKQEICIVSVSPETGKNIIVWEPIQTAKEIEFYTIYKEDKETKEFLPIADVPSTELSVFRDDESTPLSSSERYKISATNYCQIESELSKEHKTIFLQSQFNIDDYVDVIQNFYEGLHINSYNLYADSKFGPDIKIASYNALSQEAWISSISQDAGYRSLYITVDLPNPCTPFSQNGLKSDSGPFSQSISNISEAQLTDIEEDNEALIKMNLGVSPCPSNGNVVSVDVPEDGILSVLSLDGKTHFKTEVHKGSYPLSTLPVGLYIIRLNASKEYYNTFIVN